MSYQFERPLRQELFFKTTSFVSGPFTEVLSEQACNLWDAVRTGKRLVRDRKRLVAFLDYLKKKLSSLSVSKTYSFGNFLYTLDFTQSNAWEPYPEQPKWQPHTSKAASRSNNFFKYSVDGATTKHNELAKYDYNLNFATLQ